MKKRGSTEVSNDPDDLPEFFKIYVSALSSQLMRIPPDFIHNFAGNVPTTCTLARPQGASWQVDVCKVKDCWFFQKGWPDFVEDNSLQDADFLTFCYLGNSLFCVNIFSPNGCEKRGTNDPRKVADDIEKNSNFTAVLTKGYMRRRAVGIPVMFWNAHMKRGKRSRLDLTLCVENQEWNVGVFKYGSGIQIRRGWAKFVRDNNLKVGTSITFQLTDAKHLSFIVTFVEPIEV
ncbi:B3 domain-containing protein At3g06220-like [Salvia hispanica]|uniref:B3 domain-containing protein At3g06220-like n=1 Tax=Salvia hispanica TaxID=49212 RepID=UPI0020094BF4|nr:B3 domain-containing protein At3g06220-like [Salvia hispanica]